MNKIKWMLTSCVHLMLCLSLSACFSSGKGLKEPKSGNTKVVTLVGYLIGSAPSGLSDVLAELNKKLEKEVNARVELRYIQWGDMAARYPLVLSSGENVDFIFAANWAYYSQEATKGSFQEITEDLVKKYMPKHDQATNAMAWKEAEVGGKVYMIPSSTPDIKVPVTLIRGDLRKKYGLPEIHKVSELEPFLAAVKQNEPNMVPIRVDKQYDFNKTHANLQWELGPATVDLIMTTNGFSGVFTDWDDPRGKILSIFDEPLRSNYIEVAQTVKRWYDKGYINHDAFANKIRSKDSFEAGTSAVAYGNSNDIQSTIAKAEKQGWEVDIIPNLSPKKTYMMDSYINNGVAIPTDSKHKELAMQVLDLIMEDPEYNQLVYYGIEEKNFVVENGKVTFPVGMTAEQNDYAPDAAGFWFTNKSKLLPTEGWNDKYARHKEEIKQMLIPFTYSAFNFNALTVQAELDRINEVAIQYLNPILSGMVQDVDKAFLQAEAEINQAGFNKVLEEASKQTREYLNSQ
ncbi:extracellular solute-binding protein [Cohnella sp. WQ 127256]|uniref:extracellular solute-binding protein n=1 Tax=Cohnella sp. WQ 127256 TaxID=2938790 RepID=UPI0021190BC8|nr:extracellular solute-binding protein [Cohnella sp. WQ 127256]